MPWQLSDRFDVLLGPVRGIGNRPPSRTPESLSWRLAAQHLIDRIRSGEGVEAATEHAVHEQADAGSDRETELRQCLFDALDWALGGVNDNPDVEAFSDITDPDEALSAAYYALESAPVQS